MDWLLWDVNQWSFPFRLVGQLSQSLLEWWLKEPDYSFIGPFPMPGKQQICTLKTTPAICIFRWVIYFFLLFWVTACLTLVAPELLCRPGWSQTRQWSICPCLPSTEIKAEHHHAQSKNNDLEADWQRPVWERLNLLGLYLILLTHCSAFTEDRVNG